MALRMGLITGPPSSIRLTYSNGPPFFRNAGQGKRHPPINAPFIPGLYGEQDSMHAQSTGNSPSLPGIGFMGVVPFD